MSDSYSPRWAWYALVVFEIQILAAGIDLSIVSLLVRPIEIALHTSDVGFAAITATPLALGLAAAFYPAGLLADTFPRRYMIAAGCATWALAALVAARADSGAILFLARLLAGIGTGLPAPAMFSMLSDAFSRTRRAFAVSAYWSGASIGVGVGLAICGALVAATQRNGTLHVGGMLLTPWQQCFIVVAGVGILVLLLILTVPEPPRGERSMSANSNLVSSLRVFGQYLRRHWLLWALLLIGGAIGLTSYYAIAAWAPTFGMRHYGVTGTSSIALLGTFIASGSLLGSIGGGLLTQRGINTGNPRLLPRMLFVVAAVCCISAVCFPYMPSWQLAVVGIGIVNAGLSMVSLLIPIAIQETAPNEVRGQLYGLWGFLAYLPSIVAAALVAFFASGIFAKSGGLGPALAVVGGITCVSAMALFAFSSPPYKRAREESHALPVAPSLTNVM